MAPGVARHERVADVVVEVRRLALAGRDRVDVDVEDRGREEREVREARLLGAFAERRRRRVVLAVVVPAHLEPRVEPAVMVEEDAPRSGADDEGAPGDVARREERAGEAGRLAGTRASDRRDGRRASSSSPGACARRASASRARNGSVGDHGVTLAASRPLRHDAPP